MNATYVPPAETAKLIRAALKRSFPRTKFSVHTDTYAGGAAVRVLWTDGPVEALVERVAGRFAGGRFDGTIDLAYSVKHWLMPDGTATLACSPGTEDGKGVHPEVHAGRPHPDAELVRFGADYVTTRREYSEALMRRVLAKLRRDGFAWEGDEGPIERGWPVNANVCRLTRTGRGGRGAGSLWEDHHLSDVLHRVRHTFMTAAGGGERAFLPPTRNARSEWPGGGLHPPPEPDPR